MKTFIKTLAFVVILALAFAPQFVRAQGDNNVSFQTFYDQLGSQGTWIQTNQYGYVWQPTESDPNWRPYTYGHWVDTDQGMMWASDESFGWATYHYGRWVNLADNGWVWVPGYTWAPAWVSWRDSDEDVGWAPLPPDTDYGIDYADDSFDPGFGFHIGDDCDVAYGIGPAWYNFCPVAYIGDRDCWRHFRDHRDNFAFIGRTRNVTNINFHRDGSGRFGHVRAEGPRVATLNAHARTHIQHENLAATSNLADNGRVHGNSLSVFAPNVNADTRRTARPHNVSGTLANTHVNRGTDINQPLAVNSRVRDAGPTSAQVQAATQAQGNAVNMARVASPNTHFSRALNQPLTSLRPNIGREGAKSATATGTGVQPNVFTGTTHASTPSFSNDSRLTGEPATRHTTPSTFATPSTGAPTFTGEPVQRHTTAPMHTPANNGFTPFADGSSYHPSHESHTSNVSAFHPNNTPAYHSQASAPVFHQSAPVFHQSAPSFHPQSSAPAFHSSAPAFHASAPAAHVGGGGGGGGGHSGGGGGHSGGGGEHPAANSGQHH